MNNWAMVLLITGLVAFVCMILASIALIRSLVYEVEREKEKDRLKNHDIKDE